LKVSAYSFFSLHCNIRSLAANHDKYIIKSTYSKSNYDLEPLWIEIEFVNQSNIICGVIYRHFSSNLNNFMDYCPIKKINSAYLWVILTLIYSHLY